MSRASPAIAAPCLALLLTVCGPGNEARKARPPSAGPVCDARAHAPCRSAREIEALLRSDELELLSRGPIEEGAQGAAVMALRAGAVTLRAKWRAQRSAGERLAPAGEVIAHRAQQLLFAPEDFVVPPAVARCLPVEDYGPWLEPETEQRQRRGCVLGYLSYWLEGGQSIHEAREAGRLPVPEDSVWDPDPMLYEPARFERDATYRRAVANLNVLAFVIAHSDAHAGQFVVYFEPFHVYLVDHSVAFGVPPKPEMRERQNVGRLLVPAIPDDTARRVLALTRSDVEGLSRVAVLEDTRAKRVPQRVGGALDDEATDKPEGVEPDTLEVGLSPAQVAAMWERVRELQRRLESGALRTFDERSGRVEAARLRSPSRLSGRRR